MKNIFLFITIVLLSISCSIDVNSGIGGDIHVGNDTFFSPPSWIQGSWSGTFVNSNNVTVSKAYSFTQNDFIANSVSYNERINILSTTYLNRTEQITPSNYQITILHLSVNKDVYHFQYVSDSEINCKHESGTVDDWSNRVIENYSLISN
ncbi:hypothetical protein [Lutibacter flavus]|uniref:DUF4488 domain-containing protein n=1 Tax=Lutibacter flavus TaxID=691689 RepID=A0A238YXY7_9FLAO|nr:hypothetical protein [Lutibacter flavus]SNR75621.1 hypothetical protein SAMN04488111_2896 [Lutibacter flavus]